MARRQIAWPILRHRDLQLWGLGGCRLNIVFARSSAIVMDRRCTLTSVSTARLGSIALGNASTVTFRPCPSYAVSWELLINNLLYVQHFRPGLVPA